LPLSLNPNAIIWFALTLDEKTPEPERAQFASKYITCQELDEINRILDEGAQEKNDIKAREKANDAIAVGLRGWRNLPEPYDANNWRDKLTKWLTPEEHAELAFAFTTKSRLAEIDLKNSAWGVSSATANSAKPAEAATAENSPAQAAS
jgi:hypothetical protein